VFKETIYLAIIDVIVAYYMPIMMCAVIPVYYLALRTEYYIKANESMLELQHPQHVNYECDDDSEYDNDHKYDEYYNE